MNSHGPQGTAFRSIDHRRRRQRQRFPSMQLLQHDSNASLLSQQDIIMHDEEFARQEDYNRVIRRRRLIVRPVVIFLLGLFVFRKTTATTPLASEYNTDSSVRIFFRSLLGSNGSTSNANHRGPGMRTASGTEEERDKNSGLWSPAFRLRGNPSASAYNIVTDMNDDDFSDDVPSGIHEESSPNETEQGDRHGTDPGQAPPRSGTSSGTNETKKRKPDEKKSNNNNDQPSSYGWVPDSYPDPWIDPFRCGSAYLVAERLQQQHRSVDIDIDKVDLGLMTERNNNKGTPVSQVRRPRLCDPDWVLGAVNLERISQKMQEFSDRFTVAPVPSQEPSEPQPSAQPIDLAVATVRKMNVHAVLREEQLFFAYGDDDDMVNDAAQIFARSLHNQWWKNRNLKNDKNYKVTNVYDKPNGGQKEDDDDPLHESPSSRNEERRRHQEVEFFHTGGWYNDPVYTNHNDRDSSILIFLSIQDRVCFISTGDSIATILPWWRLEHVVASMKPDLRHRDYGGAIVTAIDDLWQILEAGPPTFQDRVSDFLSRFGIVLGFALFTFLFGLFGECRDRRKRWQYAENRSQLNAVELEKARLKQREFQTKACPICLEPFTGEEEEYDNDNDGTVTTDKLLTKAKMTCGMVRVDTYGIPLKGADSKNIKFLRCGHIFCESCWKAYVRSGHGNPSICPVCRQDVGKPSSKKRRNKEQRRAARRARREAAAAAAAASSEQAWLVGGDIRAIGGNGSFVPAYGSMNNTSDATTSGLSSSPTASDGNDEDANESSGDGEHESLFDMSINLFASAFGPARSTQTMNHDRSQRASSDLSVSAFGNFEEWT